MGRFKDHVEVLEVLIERFRHSFSQINASDRFLVYFLDFLLQVLETALKPFPLRVEVIIRVELVQVVVVAAAVSHRVRLFVLQKLSSVLIFFSKAKKMLNSVESFVVAEEVFELGVSVFWNSFELV